MSDPLAALRFLSWARRGAATHITNADLAATEPARVDVPVQVRFNAGAQVASLSLQLLGPGDVVAFDARAIVRAWPPPETRDAEPNFFPLVELDQADLPWRYTPRSANATGRVRPWFCLIVLKEDEAEYTPSGGGRSLGKVTISQGTPMPRVDQAWAWAHVQVSGDDTAVSSDLIAQQPERAVARLLCPRRLDEHTTYWAMLVPIFEAGRRAGLRQSLAGLTGLEPSWSPDAPPPLASTAPDGKLEAPLDLPVYYRWRFGTGKGGDFESLVRELKPRPLPDSVGTRSIDVSKPGSLPPAAVEPVPIGGALQAPLAEPWFWPTDVGERAEFVDELADILNLPDTLLQNGTGTPVVAPPLYGAWHARSWRLLPGQAPPWFHDLNEDPRKRIAAALGTEVVQTQQDALMASAWEQLEGIREANDQLRKAQFARAIGERLHLRFVQPGNADIQLTFTSAAHGHVRHGTKTMRALVENSPARLALLGGPFRRLARPLGPLGRRQERQGLEGQPVVSEVNDGSYDSVLAATPPAPTALPTWSWLTANVDVWPLQAPPGVSEIAAEPPRPDVLVWDPEYENPPSGDPGSPESPSMSRFRDAATAFANREVEPQPGETLRRLDLSAVRTTVVSALDPAVTIPTALQGRLVRRADFMWNPPDPVEPVMAHPEFPQAMYKALAERSPEWILPGLSEVSANSVALAVTNQVFVEAYMVGLNHEMARELLWNEYPTDQRGSYFRQFWDPAGLAPTPVPDTAKDILRFDDWTQTSALGEHSPREGPPGGTHLVLLVRGEVLRRYPGTLVYAQRAQGPVGERTLDDADEQRLPPVFGGRLHPDVAFFGFDLTVAEARGGETDPGWFFVFEEQPGEPRFGLDVSAASSTPTSWDDLAWTHLAATPEELALLGYIDLEAALPDTSGVLAQGAGWRVAGTAPVARGADHAFITFQRPVRVAMHGAELLP